MRCSEPRSWWSGSRAITIRTRLAMQQAVDPGQSPAAPLTSAPMIWPTPRKTE